MGECGRVKYDPYGVCNRLAGHTGRHTSAWGGDYQEWDDRPSYVRPPTLSFPRGTPTDYAIRRIAKAFDVPEEMITGSHNHWSATTVELGNHTNQGEEMDIEARLKGLYSQIDQLEERAAAIRRFGEDIYDDGDVITFDKQFYPDGMAYSYAAIRSNGLWYTTGPKSPKGYTWVELVNWLTDGPVPELWRVLEEERIA